MPILTPITTVLTEQVALYPDSGATLFTLGDPLHARFMFDAGRHLNNLWAYCDVPVVFCMGPFGYVLVQMETGTASKEIYVAQVPILIPAGSARLVWTLGGNIASAAAKTTTVTRFDLYLASQPYTGPSYDFDTSYLTPNYGHDYKTVTWSAGSGVTGAYQFVDQSSGGMSPLIGHGSDGVDQMGILILTATGTGTDATGTLDTSQLLVRDFTAWILKE